MLEKYVLEAENIVVVALGSFNPTIFHPLWFSKNGLLAENEADEAQVQFMHPEIASFTAGDWLKIEVTQNRFLVSTEDPAKNHAVRDLALGTFLILEHTPLNRVGINRNIHFRIESDALWHAVGDYFAPKASWNAILDGDAVRTGLLELVIVGNRSDSSATRLQFKLSPSQVAVPGIYIQVNQHYELASIGAGPNEGLEHFVGILSTEWDSFITYTTNACKKLIDDALGDH